MHFLLFCFHPHFLCFRVKQSKTAWLWKWRHSDPPKRLEPLAQRHCHIQKTWICYVVGFITTNVTRWPRSIDINLKMSLTLSTAATFLQTDYSSPQMPSQPRLEPRNSWTLTINVQPVHVTASSDSRSFRVTQKVERSIMKQTVQIISN